MWPRRRPRSCRYFYPRPLRGGRLTRISAKVKSVRFLSTPSARRATRQRPYLFSGGNDFYPRPLRGGRPAHRGRRQIPESISIHALCEEGDPHYPGSRREITTFLSTPSARRATWITWGYRQKYANFYPRPLRGGRPASVGFAVAVSRFLSTPSARRATRGQPAHLRCSRNFYPRPLRGGRPAGDARMTVALLFLSTPSARRATARTRPSRPP